MLRKFKIPVIILIVLLMLALNIYNGVFGSTRLANIIEGDYRMVGLPIEIDESLPDNVGGWFAYREYTLNGMKLLDPDSLAVYMNPKHRNDPYILSHEFGHYLGTVYFNDKSEAFANSYARYAMKELIKGTTDDWTVDAKLLLSVGPNLEIYNEFEFKNKMSDIMKYGLTDLDMGYDPEAFSDAQYASITNSNSLTDYSDQSTIEEIYETEEELIEDGYERCSEEPIFEKDGAMYYWNDDGTLEILGG